MKKIYLPLVAIAILLALSITVVAGPRPKNTFNGSSFGDFFDLWSSSSNWSLGRIPASGDSIVIKTGQTVHFANFASGSTSTYTQSLNNVIIIVQKGAVLQLGNGTSGSHNYYGVLILDNASSIGIEKVGSSAGQIIASPRASTNGANNQITIGGQLKFGGNTKYSTINSSGVGFINGPARADASTGNNSNGFTFGSLPVVLVGFNANLTAGNKVDIEWNTQQEISTDHFEIQRSNDGLNWQTLATVKASGFSSTPMNYSCSDVSPAKGINLYRLKMVDFDGNFGYSDVVNVRLNLMGKVSLYPNPSVSSVTVSLSEVPASDWTVSLINISGQTVLQKQFSKSLTTATLPVGIYPTGNYTVQISDGISSQVTRLMIAHQ
jgi:hypothetical protein